MKNGGETYLQRRQAAEAFANQIKAAAANPAVLNIDVMEKARKIVVMTARDKGIVLENNDYSAEQLAHQINERLASTNA